MPVDWWWVFLTPSLRYLLLSKSHQKGTGEMAQWLECWLLFQRS